MPLRCTVTSQGCPNSFSSIMCTQFFDVIVLFSDVVDSGPFRYVSAFMNAKPYVKYVSNVARSMITALKLVQEK